MTPEQRKKLEQEQETIKAKIDWYDRQQEFLNELKALRQKADHQYTSDVLAVVANGTNGNHKKIYGDIYDGVLTALKERIDSAIKDQLAIIAINYKEG